MKKNEQKIKKEEKEEKNLRKLIYADTDFNQNRVKPLVLPNEEFKDGEANMLVDDGPHSSKGGRRDRGSGVYLRS